MKVIPLGFGAKFSVIAGRVPRTCRAHRSPAVCVRFRVDPSARCCCCAPPALLGSSRAVTRFVPVFGRGIHPSQRGSSHAPEFQNSVFLQIVASDKFPRISQFVQVFGKSGHVKTRLGDHRATELNITYNPMTSAGPFVH